MEFKDGNQLKVYIQKERKETPMNSEYAYKYFFFRNFLKRLYENDLERFVLKGSFSQFATLKKFTRPLTDIDIITFGSVESATDVVDKILLGSDKIKFDVKQKFVTTNATINYRILCNFDKINHLITIDLRKEKMFETEITKLPELFSKDKEFDVNTSTLEEHLSRKLYITFLNYKLHTMLGKEFRRFKDLFDIHSIMEKGNVDFLKVIELTKERIKEDEFLRDYDLRGRLIETDFVKDNKGNWLNDSKRYEFDKNVTFEKAVEVTNDLLSRGM